MADELAAAEERAEHWRAVAEEERRRRERAEKAIDVLKKSMRSAAADAATAAAAEAEHVRAQSDRRVVAMKEALQ